MSKFLKANETISSFFSNPEWTAHSITTVPQNFGRISGECIRVSILTGGLGVNFYSTSGLVQIEIFVEADNGVRRAIEIVDLLESLLGGKVKKVSEGTLQLGTGTAVPIGNDPENPSLYKFLYSITFNFYGVS